MSEQQQAEQLWQSTAETLARSAGTLIRQLLTSPRQIQSKGFRDVVTDADFAAQQLITNGLREQFPDHGFLAEEENPDLPSEGPVQWLIDPIDGTSNYSRGIPNFCVSIAALVNDKVVVGVIYDPMSDELFSARRQHGCTLNGVPIQTSNTPDLAEAILAIDLGRQHHIRQRSTETFLRLVHNVRSLRMIGSSALTMAWVAAGRIDGHLSYQLSAWDIAAGSLLIQEAGGRITTADNQPLVLGREVTCLSSNGMLHEELVEGI
jgi:myo-inositol-1(or 4)-monophosphatase